VLDRAPMNLGQAVDCFLLQFWRMMLVPIPFGVSSRISEAKIGREIDHFGRWRLHQKIFDDLLRGCMRQGTEYDIERQDAPVEALNGDELWQREGRKLRKYIPHRLAGAALGREQDDVGARMTEQYPHKLSPGITRGAQHSDLRFCSHESILIQKS